MHPDNLDRESLVAGMVWQFAAGDVTGLLALLHLVLLRVDLEIRRVAASSSVAEWDRDGGF